MGVPEIVAVTLIVGLCAIFILVFFKRDGEKQEPEVHNTAPNPEPAVEASSKCMDTAFLDQLKYGGKGKNDIVLKHFNLSRDRRLNNGDVLPIVRYGSTKFSPEQSLTLEKNMKDGEEITSYVGSTMFQINQEDRRAVASDKLFRTISVRTVNPDLSDNEQNPIQVLREDRTLAKTNEVILILSGENQRKCFYFDSETKTYMKLKDGKFYLGVQPVRLYMDPTQINTAE